MGGDHGTVSEGIYGKQSVLARILLDLARGSLLHNPYPCLPADFSTTGSRGEHVIQAGGSDPVTASGMDT